MAAFDASDLDAPMSPQSVPSATAESAYPNPWREIKEYFLKHDITGVYHKLEALRHKGWQDPKSEAWFKSRQQMADTAKNDRASEQWLYAMMQEIGDEMEATTGVFSHVKKVVGGEAGEDINVLDLCMAPGGYTSAALKYIDNAKAHGITLPGNVGGYNVLLPEGKATIEFLDITLLLKEYTIPWEQDRAERGLTTAAPTSEKQEQGQSEAGGDADPNANDNDAGACATAVAVMDINATTNTNTDTPQAPQAAAAAPAPETEAPPPPPPFNPVPLVPFDHPDKRNFILTRPFASQTFPLVLADGHVLRTHPRALYREKHEYQRLILSQAILAVQRLPEIGGTFIMLLHKLEAPRTVAMVYLWSRFSRVRLFKSVKKWGVRSSFYLVARDVRAGSKEAREAVEFWKRVWWECTFGDVNGGSEDDVLSLPLDLDEGASRRGERGSSGSGSGSAVGLDPAVVERKEEEVRRIRGILEVFGSRLVELARPLWEIQSRALERQLRRGFGMGRREANSSEEGKGALN